jgi:hypothetical protein
MRYIDIAFLGEPDWDIPDEVGLFALLSRDDMQHRGSPRFRCADDHARLGRRNTYQYGASRPVARAARRVPPDSAPG